MAIPESQLETWSHQGSIAGSAQTYDAIKRVLDDVASPYNDKNYSIFLQGSYGNDTNVYKDSDVDIVIRLDQTYYADTSALNPNARDNYEAVFSQAAYSYFDFKYDVLAWLNRKFGSDTKAGIKAIFVEGRGNRRDSDVIVCAEHRRYRAESTGSDFLYDEGIIFWSSEGSEIVNFPNQHSVNCTTKHQNTNQRFNRMVRVYKNMRNRMIDDKLIPAGLAPSYFIEGLLWNVPAINFLPSYEDSFVKTFNWILDSDRAKLSSANELFWLVRNSSNECWSTEDFENYLTAARAYWDNWNK